MDKSVTPPTHEEAGYTTYTCSSCQYTYDASFVAPVPHDLKSEVTAPSCTAEGYTTYVCDCGYTYKSDFTAPVPHVYREEVIEPTCTAEGYMQSTCNCGYSFKSSYTPPLMHSFKIIEDISATCTTEGYKTGECERCKERYTYDIVSPLGHDLTVKHGYVSLYNGLAASDYTCSRCELGYTGNFLFYGDVYHGAYVDNTEVLAKGIDVSYHNSNQNSDGSYAPLDFDIIKAAGFDFAILRAGYIGTSGTFVTDKVFEQNYAAARAAGLYVGAYIYSYAYTREDARAEALAMIQALDGKQFEYPIFFDIEYGDDIITQKGLTRQSITEICNEFISTMQDAGYFAALYTNNKWLTEYLLTSQVTATFDIWYARYLYTDNTIVVNEATWNTEKYGKQMAMWQFSETGTIDGIYDNDTGELQRFDLNYCYKDYPALIKKYGLNGFPLELGI